MIDAAVAAVRSGLVVGLPTDTVYGIGADPLSPEAVRRLYELKGRPEGKPVGILVADIEQADEVAVIEGAARDLATEHWPGALTLVVRPRVVMADWVGDMHLETLGIRVPDHQVARDLLRATGPLAVTSANLSGGPEAMTDVQARAIFGNDVALYLEGESPGGEASTVVDATGPTPTVLRPGPIRV